MALVLSWAPGVKAQEISASNGASLPVPDIQSLDCDQLLDLMHRYAASRYRAPGVIPEAEADKRLFAYEHELSAVHYEKCHLGRSKPTVPSQAFGEGFN